MSSVVPFPRRPAPIALRPETLTATTLSPQVALDVLTEFQRLVRARASGVVLPDPDALRDARVRAVARLLLILDDEERGRS